MSQNVKQHLLYISPYAQWRSLLKENGGSHHQYRGRATRISLYSMLTQPLQSLDKWIYQKKIQQETLVPDPVFILGHWRSGTTHLHYLCSQDAQFGFLSNYQAFLFNIALLGGSPMRKLLSPWFPQERPMDNTAFNADLPAEEELPFCNISERGSYHSMWFPNNESYFERYCLFQGVGESDIRAWKSEYLYLLKRISLLNGSKRLLLKNPYNTARIKILLELFPQAKFIYIHRDPLMVYPSTQRWFQKLVESQYLHPLSDKERDLKIVRYYRAIVQQYLDQKHLIPPQNLVEVGFDQLESDPMKEMERIYMSLGLENFDSVRPKIQAYNQSVQGYKKNVYHINEETKQMLTREWEFAFQHWNYPLPIINAST